MDYNMSKTPSRIIIAKDGKNIIPDRYIVELKPEGDLNGHLDWMREQAMQHSSQFEVIQKYEFINGYAAKLNGLVLENLAQRDDVKAIVADRVGTLDT
ncbi:unnamed protein product [Rhizoctonia solani]|uniref:Inhibitor I9 domain-containing protein n=2 Tax=Rhizoctonia solani TaxID=456999 RepID=A0A8H3DCH2_9AGAM